MCPSMQFTRLLWHFPMCTFRAPGRFWFGHVWPPDRQDRPPPKISLFSPSPAAKLPSLGGFSWNFGCVFPLRDPQMCTAPRRFKRARLANFDFGQLFLKKRNRANTICSTSANFDFGQFRLRPISSVGWRPKPGKSVAPKALKGGARRVGAQNFALPLFILSSLSWGSLSGILVVFEAPEP